MRKSLVIFIALFTLSSYVISQKMTFRTYQIILEYDDQTNVLNNNTTILFLDISIDKRTLHISPGLVYYIVSEGKVIDQGIDKDGDEYEVAIFEAIDNDRDRCFLFIKRWPKLKYVHFFIKYDSFELIYLTTQID